ncbi:MAG: hypothetical protein GEV11_18325 [Streptosporangiales bacterium]|nr:hypothetical protein [Streptosporangiales bacterium]
MPPPASTCSAAAEAGRSPADVRRLYNITGTFGRGAGFLQGPPAAWAEQFAELTLTEGTSAYILAADSATLIERFAAEVAPAVHDLVTTERAAETSPAPRHGDGAATTLASTGGGRVESPADEAIVRDGGDGARVPAGLGVEPTPDDGVRLSRERVWDESTRPTVPAPDLGRGYTAHERASGRHLVDVHDHLRQELAQVRDIMEQVLAGNLDPGAARTEINRMTMRQNNRTLGAYCESYCRLVTVHHTLEDHSLFPRLRRADPRLVPVIERLRDEHEVIHEVLEGVDRALVAFVADPGDGSALRDAVDLLTDTLLSHLSYEERELVEPLARIGVS